MTAVREVIGNIKWLSQTELILTIVLVFLELLQSLIFLLRNIHLKFVEMI